MALLSPETPANKTISASVMVLAKVAVMPSERSSRSKPFKSFIHIPPAPLSAAKPAAFLTNLDRVLNRGALDKGEWPRLAIRSSCGSGKRPAARTGARSRSDRSFVLTPDGLVTSFCVQCARCFPAKTKQISAREGHVNEKNPISRRISVRNDDQRAANRFGPVVAQFDVRPSSASLRSYDTRFLSR